MNANSRDASTPRKPEASAKRNDRCDLINGDVKNAVQLYFKTEAKVAVADARQRGVTTYEDVVFPRQRACVYCLTTHPPDAGDGDAAGILNMALEIAQMRADTNRGTPRCKKIKLMSRDEYVTNDRLLRYARRTISDGAANNQAFLKSAWEKAS